MQGALNAAEEACVEVDRAYLDALDGLSEFSHAWLITWLGELDPPAVELRQVPFLLRRSPGRLGIFAMRGPRRPSLVGLTLVRIVEVAPPTIRFTGVDMVDGTPVIDIKPHVERVDRPPDEVRGGWFDSIDLEPGSTPATLAEPRRPRRS